MSRKDYEAIAAAIKAEATEWGDLVTESDKQVLRAVAQRIARVFESDNPRFDRAKFLRACGF